MDSYDTMPSGLRLYRDAGRFKLGTDSGLLSDFASVRARGARRCCDLGAGAGVIGLMLACGNPRLSVDGVELQRQAVEIFLKNINENGMDGRVRAFCRDLRRCRDFLEAGTYDLVVSNPPYFSAASRRPRDDGRAAVRSELFCTLFELCRSASWLLKNGGHFSLVFRPERLCELFSAMTRCGLEPKRLCFAARDAQSSPSLVLVEGKKQGRTGLMILPAIYLKGGTKQ